MSSASFGTNIRFSKSLTKSITGYWIPTQNEWYKAAFYDPTLNSGTSGSYSYSVKTNYDNKPVLYVNWLDCARYCNWLTNGKPNGSQNVSTTETVNYRLYGLNVVSFSTDDPTIASSNATFVDPNNTSVPIAI